MPTAIVDDYPQIRARCAELAAERQRAASSALPCPVNDRISAINAALASRGLSIRAQAANAAGPVGDC